MKKNFLNRLLKNFLTIKVVKISTDTKILKLITSWKYFSNTVPNKIAGIQIVKKDFLTLLPKSKSGILLINLKYIKFIKLVNIETGNNIEMVSTIL